MSSRSPLANIIGHASQGPGLDAGVARRVDEYRDQVDPGLGADVAKVLAESHEGAGPPAEGSDVEIPPVEV
ncbi:MAG TPA: hypothetical protein VGG43_02250 [Acidimicrobiales bacterium]